MASRSKSKKKTGTTPKVSGFGKKSLKGELQRAIGFLKRGKLEKAHSVLTELDQLYPDNPDVLVEWANYYAAIPNLNQYQGLCERLLKLDTHQPTVMLGLAKSYLAVGSPILALKTFRGFVQQFPHHAEVDEVKQFLKDLEGELETLLSELKVSNDQDGFELASQHELVQCYLNRSEFQSARELGLTILEQQPELLPVHNNVSLAYFFEGDFQSAVEQCFTALDQDATNIHALSNIIRYLYCVGEVEEAKERVPELLASNAKAYDPWTKKLEALSYVGDYEGVLNTYEQALATGDIEGDRANDFFLHLGAVAMARLGRLSDARKVWQGLVRRSPNFSLAQENLQDSNQPAGQRHGAWAFDFNQWISPFIINGFKTELADSRLLDSDSKQPEEERNEALRQLFADFIDRYPYLNHLFQVWLEHGSPEARHFAWMITSLVKAPEHLNMLKSFALSQWGPDDTRYQAAIKAVQGGVMEKKARLWLRGEWQDIVLMAYEFHDEMQYSHEPAVQKVLEFAILQMREVAANRDRPDAPDIYAEVEEALKEGLKLEPDAPDLRNNLAVVYNLQERTEEALALWDEIIEDSPNYVFARTSRAKLYLTDKPAEGSISEEVIEKVKALLMPMLEWDRFHFDDFSEFSDAYIWLLLAQDQDEGARGWVKMWEQVDPDNPKLFRWKRSLKDAETRVERAKNMA
ncbi:MAG: tetratricopeptide repeat protein [Symploca sp. SIO2B6]|nr:tetratricopeptide repeat protein [Symploca sp. SIO2B6]